MVATDHTILEGDWIKRMRELPDRSVQMVGFSPPYPGQRDYGVPGQLGWERTIEEYVGTMVAGCREVWRLLRDDGVMWINLGHKFNDSGGAGGDYGDVGLRRGQRKYPAKRYPGYKPTDCIPVPWLVAIALQQDGWFFRCPVEWRKPQCFPTSCMTRPTIEHEDVLMFTKRKSGLYLYDWVAIAEPVSPHTHSRGNGLNPKAARQAQDGLCRQNRDYSAAIAGKVKIRNKRSVWVIPNDEADPEHNATFPVGLALLWIASSTSEHGACAACGAPWERAIRRDSHYRKRRPSAFPHSAPYQVDSTGWRHAEIETLGWRPTCDCGTEEVRPCVVLDPFMGSGTTAVAAYRLGRSSIGIELNPETAQRARERLERERLQLPRVERAEDRQQLCMEVQP